MGTCDLINITPSQSTYNGKVDSLFSEHLTTADEDVQFIEWIEASSDNRLILLVPHGGGIEPPTDDQIESFKQAIENTCPDGFNPAIWVCEGDYEEPGGANQIDTHDQWHITAKAINPAAFPALNHLLATTNPYLPSSGSTSQPNVLFQYAVSLHGYEGTGGLKQLIIGDRAAEADKRMIQKGIMQAFAPGTCDIDFQIMAYNQTVSHSGTDPNNIVNRLSWNPVGDPGYGGIQIEQSKTLREAPGYAAKVARGLAIALCRLIEP